MSEYILGSHGGFPNCVSRGPASPRSETPFKVNISTCIAVAEDLVAERQAWSEKTQPSAPFHFAVPTIAGAGTGIGDSAGRALKSSVNAAPKSSITPAVMNDDV